MNISWQVTNVRTVCHGNYNMLSSTCVIRSFLAFLAFMPGILAYSATFPGRLSWRTFDDCNLQWYSLAT